MKRSGGTQGQGSDSGPGSCQDYESCLAWPEPAPTRTLQAVPSRTPVISSRLTFGTVSTRWASDRATSGAPVARVWLMRRFLEQMLVGPVRKQRRVIPNLRPTVARLPGPGATWWLHVSSHRGGFHGHGDLRAPSHRDQPL